MMDESNRFLCKNGRKYRLLVFFKGGNVDGLGTM